MKPKLWWLAKKQQCVQETMGPCANTSIAALGSAAPYVVGRGLQPQHSPTVQCPHYQPLTYNLHAQHMAEAFMLNMRK